MTKGPHPLSGKRSSLTSFPKCSANATLCVESFESNVTKFVVSWQYYDLAFEWKLTGDGHGGELEAGEIDFSLSSGNSTEDILPGPRYADPPKRCCCCCCRRPTPPPPPPPMPTPPTRVLLLLCTGLEGAAGGKKYMLKDIRKKLLNFLER